MGKASERPNPKAVRVAEWLRKEIHAADTIAGNYLVDNNEQQTVAWCYARESLKDALSVLCAEFGLSNEEVK